MKYNTEIMKDEEVLLYVETAIENGSSPQEAIADMRMIDTLLAVERNHILAFGSVNRTAAGRYRRNSTLVHALDSVVTARALNIEM